MKKGRKRDKQFVCTIRQIDAGSADTFGNRSRDMPAQEPPRGFEVRLKNREHETFLGIKEAARTF